MTRLITIEYDEYLDLLKYRNEMRININQEMIYRLSKISTSSDDVNRFIKSYINLLRAESTVKENERGTTKDS